MTFLVLSLPAIAAIAYYFDAPLTNEQWAAVSAALRVYLGVALVCFVTAEITRNYSQVDKVRTLIAVYYVWYFAAMSGWNERMVWMATLTIVWSARLTYNLIRRGGFSWMPWGGKEDYRWVTVKTETPAVLTTSIRLHILCNFGGS